MEEEPTVDIQSNGQRRCSGTIRIVNIVYWPTPDAEERLLEALALLLGKGGSSIATHIPHVSQKET